MRPKRLIFPLVIGLAGAGVLASLGKWQLDRLAWKEGVLAEIEARIDAPPVAVPSAPEEETDKYLPVVAEGDILGASLHSVTSVPRVGPGHRLISVFQLDDGRRVMVDEGFVPGGGDVSPGGAERVSVLGNLHWPDEVDDWTPAPDLTQNLFYGRDVAAMAAALGTEPTLIVAREISGVAPRAAPLPVTSVGIPNNHLGYAVQWFGLAAVWTGMTAFFIWRMTRRGEKGTS
ncbi:MAG: SURF1 family protein [Pseudomonadota bacterium]